MIDLILESTSFENLQDKCLDKYLIDTNDTLGELPEHVRKLITKQLIPYLKHQLSVKEFVAIHKNTRVTSCKDLAKLTTDFNRRFEWTY